MDWTAPQIDPEQDRPFEAYAAGERAQLDAFLDYHRQTLLWKCSGLTADQLKVAPVPPSNLSLLGLVRHLTEVEHAWFSCRVRERPLTRIYDTDESPDGDFLDLADADAAADLASYRAECERSREVAAALPLDHTFVHPRQQKSMSLRFVYLHMLEEYARHNGHADLIRERIDGATGE